MIDCGAMISTDQVTALAPDATSLKAGKALASASKWSNLGCNDQLIWGLAGGSGQNPYQTQVNVVGFVYKCSCPSRKFPCKHALGLMLLVASDPTLFKDSQLPEWVQAWVETRNKKKKTAKKKNAKPRNKETASRSRLKREVRVDEGVTFLQNFLLDLLRQGLGQCDFRDRAVWDGVSRRLIDCQAPGLAASITRIAELSITSTESRLLHEIAAVYFLLHSYAKKKELTLAEQSELDQRIGWQVEKESVLATPPVQDDWFIAFRSLTKPSHLTIYSTWLFGCKTRKWALMLSFSAAGAAPTLLWPVGGIVSTELCFYPGVCAERSLPVDEAATVKSGIPDASIGESTSDLLTRVSASLGENPWRYRYPFLLRAQPVVKGSKSWLVDESGYALPWNAVASQQLTVSTICGGKSRLMAGEWDGYQCHLFAAEDNGTWFALRNQFS